MEKKIAIVYQMYVKLINKKTFLKKSDTKCLAWLRRYRRVHFELADLFAMIL